MVQCLVGLGSNLGESQQILDRAVDQLNDRLQVVAVSNWHAYPCVGPAADGTMDQPDFLNGVAVVESSVSPHETADMLHSLERSAGRNRVVRWSSRTLDADLLTYGQEIVRSESLQVPHPRMMSRRFVLEPACEIAPDLRHPVIGWTMQELFDHLCIAQPYFALVGLDQEKIERIATQLAAATKGKFHAIHRNALSSLPSDSVVQSAKEQLTIISNEIRSGGLGPWFTDFWIDEFEIPFSPEGHDSAWNPKLVLVTEPEQSTFAKNLATKIGQPSSRPSVPMLYLSQKENEAWQDALGAVQGMR